MSRPSVISDLALRWNPRVAQEGLALVARLERLTEAEAREFSAVAEVQPGQVGWTAAISLPADLRWVPSLAGAPPEASGCEAKGGFDNARSRRTPLRLSEELRIGRFDAIDRSFARIPSEWQALLRDLLECYFQTEHRLALPASVLQLGPKTGIMGILNVTPDSFYDGGRYLHPQAAKEHGLRMIEEGAQIVDVGAESTRPGSTGVPAAEEMDRLLPVVESLKGQGAAISVDTRKAVVAEAAIRAGAIIVNDTSGLRADPEMIPLVARSAAAAVIMHIQGTPETMQVDPRYGDVRSEVLRTLREWVADAVRGGVPPDRILVDPGIGFGKRLEHNLALLRHLDELRSLGFPVVVGPSRKRFIGEILGQPSPDGRLAGTLAAVAACHAAHVSLVRVHDVNEVRQFLDILEML